MKTQDLIGNNAVRGHMAWGLWNGDDLLEEQ